MLTLKMYSAPNSEAECPVILGEMTERKTALAMAAFGNLKEELLHGEEEKVLFAAGTALMRMEVA